MKSAFYNPERAKQEEEEKKIKKTEDEKRVLYLESLKRNRNFQRYVVDEILRRNIEALTDTRRLNAEARTKEEIADVILANIKASRTLENILSQLL
jgi:hypothetical protein